MIIDTRSFDGAPPSYDVVIVGSGPAGLTLALELSKQDLRICVLESGGMDLDPDTQALYEAPVEGMDHFDPTSTRLRMFGGTSNHWGGRCMPLQDIDFDRKPLSGESGWPFTRKDLDPHYARAHDYLDLGDFDYDVKADPSYTDSRVFFADDAAIETRVVRNSTPTRFADKYLDVLQTSDAIDVWLWANVASVELDALGQANALSVRTLTGRTHTFTGNLIVLAMGAMETARLWLDINASGGTTFGGDYVGRCYMDHPLSPAGTLWFQDHQAPNMNTEGGLSPTDQPLEYALNLSETLKEKRKLANAHFYLYGMRAGSNDPTLRRSNTAKIAIKDIAKWADGTNRKTLSEAYCEALLNLDALVLDVAGRLPDDSLMSHAEVLVEAEQTPDPKSRVELISGRDALGQQNAKLVWSPTEADRESVRQSVIELGRAVGASGLGRLEMAPTLSDRYWGADTAYHQMGTMRMAETEGNGAVDPNGRIFGTQNVYVAGGAVMPQSGSSNPTLTIVALTIRLADHLKRVLSP